MLGDKNGCHVRDVGNAEVLGDMQDKGYVKLGGGWCLCDGYFLERKHALEIRRKTHSEIKNFSGRGVGGWL